MDAIVTSITYKKAMSTLLNTLTSNFFCLRDGRHLRFIVESALCSGYESDWMLEKSLQCLRPDRKRGARVVRLDVRIPIVIDVGDIILVPGE